MQTAADLLSEIHDLMALQGENPFKIRAFEKAQAAIAGHVDLAERARAGTLTEIAGVGKSIAEILQEFLLEGTSRVRDDLAASIPPGLRELTRVPGLGPKKALLLIQDFGITSLGELEYACRENRLVQIPGFGQKLQAKIQEGLQTLKAAEGKALLGDVWDLAEKLRGDLAHALDARVELAGAIRRRCEILEAIEFAVDATASLSSVDRELSEIARRVSPPLPLRATRVEDWGYAWVETTATAEHWAALGAPAPKKFQDETAFYKSLNLPWIAPEARETGEEVAVARVGGLRELLPIDGLRGIFHNHTSWSDGTASVLDMVRAARDAGYSYIGISDHSQSAAYAQGLKEDALKRQELEIQVAREQFPEIRIFWGVESDILADGSLDYSEAQLKKFDFVIASIHSRFQMDRDQMTDRVLAAIRNPYTTMVGHLTGRLLLARKPFELDVPRVIHEAADRGVAIEINANPQRLDIDWRWGQTLRQTECCVVINPDAHAIQGIQDTRFGVAMARKALLPAAQVINTLDVRGIEAWLQSKKR